MLAIAPQTETVFAVVMPYPESVLPASITVALTAICLAIVGWAIYGTKRR